jgi:hypothetical protein
MKSAKVFELPERTFGQGAVASSRRTDGGKP